MQEITQTPAVDHSWFDEIIALIRTRQLQIETNTADVEVTKWYNTMTSGDVNEMAKHSRMLAQKHFISNILVEYFNELKSQLPAKLAFDFNDSEVLVWAEINEGR